MIEKQKIVKRGVVLIACGHPFYGNMAAHLAASIKFSSPDMPIALLHDASGIRHLNNEKLNLFDNKITAPTISYTNKGKTDLVFRCSDVLIHLHRVVTQ